MPPHPALAPDAIRDVVRDLVRIPSVNPTLAPDEAGGTGELAIAQFAREWLEARGVNAWLEEAAPGRPNVVAEVIGRARGEVDGDGSAGESGSGSVGPTLVLCAHLDTVGTAGMTIPPFDPRVDGDRLCGRGSYDMKGSAGAILSAMAALAQDDDVRRGLRGRVLAALVCDEEYASLGAFDFVRRHPRSRGASADSGNSHDDGTRRDVANRDSSRYACIVTEPAGPDTLVLAHKGFVWAEIVTEGRAAHGSRWDVGVSAIGKMGRIIAALEEFDRTELRARTHPLVGSASLHCALVSGGTGLSTYAHECRLKVERRTIPGETPDQVRRELEAVVAGAGAAARVDCYFDRPPLTCDSQTPIARAVRDAVTQVTGRPPVDGGVGFWMDAAVFAQAGIDTVNYGPTGAGAHEAVEWVDLPSVVQTAHVLVEAARRFCA
jgi:acetylornithine deacetylase